MSRGALAAGIALGVIGVAMYMVEPLYVGALADHLGLKPAELGLVVTSEAMAMMLASLSAPFWIHRINLRRTATIAISITAAGNLASSFLNDFFAFAIARFLIGLLGAGPAFTLAVRVIGETGDPDRGFGLVVAAQVAYSAVGLAVLPFIIERGGHIGVFVWIAAVALPVLFLVGRLPDEIGTSSGTETDSAETRIRAYPVLLLAVQVVWYLGLGAIWAFIERIASAMALEPREIGLALAVGMGLSLAGSAQAAWMGDRLGSRWQMPLMLVVHGLVYLSFLLKLTFAQFLVAMAVFNYSWNFALPYFLGAISRAEEGGRWTVLIPACQTIGVMIGPWMAGAMVVGQSFVPVIGLALGCSLVSLVLILGASAAQSGPQ